MAFGTGQHATTALCLRLLDRHLADQPPATLLDVGTGSGILALAAARFGVERIVAIDNDVAALAVAAENLQLNPGCGERVVFGDAPITDIDQRFDWVVANILAHVLIELADGILGAVARGGTLVLTGVLASQRDAVLEAYASAAARSGREPLKVCECVAEDEWIALLLR